MKKQIGIMYYVLALSTFMCVFCVFITVLFVHHVMSCIFYTNNMYSSCNKNMRASGE